jgi:sugar phosphate isomerase/epimerase
LKVFGDRLIMTHLHDNFGTRGVPTTLDDLHLLPGDGNIHWEQAIGRLRELPKQEILNFELKKLCKSNDPGDRLYAQLSTEEYFRLAAQRARQIADLYEKESL